jgi:hypothetical protein
MMKMCVNKVMTIPDMDLSFRRVKKLPVFIKKKKSGNFHITELNYDHHLHNLLIKIFLKSGNN